jgi:molybdate transport system ATP-binding protein
VDGGEEGARELVERVATDVVLSLAPPHELSARSALSSKVSKIQFDGPLATVELALEGNGRLFATVTRGALNELDLKPGSHVFSLFKTAALDERGIGGVPAHVSENSADLTTSDYQRNPRA